MDPFLSTAEGMFKGIVKPILDKWIPDASERLAAENMIFNASQAVTMAQIEVNKMEATSASVFVAGWRPAVGWICAASLFYSSIGHAFLSYTLRLYSAYKSVLVPELPNPDVTINMELLFGMLGLGGLRTYEKLKGLTK